VTDLYLHILDRAPDAGGLAYWIGRLGAGDRVASVAVSIYGSPEYYAEAGSTPAGYVDALYESVLDRAAEPAGRAYWIDRLGAGTSRWVVARNLFLSFEARSRRVDALYLTLLGRPASVADRAYWADRLAREDDIVLAAHLVSSAEHQARAQTRADTADEPISIGPATTVAQPHQSLFPPSTPAVAVSGDAATVVHSREESYSASMQAVDVAAGLTETIAPVNAPGGIFPSAHPLRPSVSDDGRFVVTGDPSGPETSGPVSRLVDRLAGTVDDLGAASGIPRPAEVAPSISPDGSTIAWHQRGGETDDIVVRDRATGATTVEVAGDGHSQNARLSRDGRWMVFASAATDLVAGDTNGQVDVFLRDRTTGATTRVTGGDGPSGEPWISADGSTVAFSSTATDLVADDTGDDGPAADVYVWNRPSGTTRRASDGATAATGPSVSGDGRTVVFVQVGPTEAPAAVATVWERSTGATTVLPLDGQAVVLAQVTTDGGDVVAATAGFRFVRWPIRTVDRLAVTPTALPDAVPHQPYEVELTITGGSGPSVVDTRLPRGLALEGTTLAGTPGFRPGTAIVALVLGDGTGRRSLHRRSIELPAEGTLTAFDADDLNLQEPASLAGDGSTIAYARNLGYGDEEVRRILPDLTDELVAAGRAPSLSADGATIAFLSPDALVPGDPESPGGGGFDAYVAGPDGLVVLARGSAGGGAVAVALSGDATTAVVASQAPDVIPADPGAGTFLVDVATGAATRLTRHGEGPVAISRDGSVAVATEPRPDVGAQVVRFEDGTRRVLDTSWFHAYPSLDVSADGDHVAYAKHSRFDGQPSVLRVWSKGGGAAITLDDSAVGSVRISGDGGIVMFVGGDGPAGAPGHGGDVYRWERATGEVSWAVANVEGGGGIYLDLADDGGTALLTTYAYLAPSPNSLGRMYTWTAPAG
jgi:hypothetical protein